MATLILINGQGGAGKSTTAKTLLRMLRPAAYIPADSLVSVEPFEWNDALLGLGIRNAALLIRFVCRRRLCLHSAMRFAEPPGDA